MILNENSIQQSISLVYIAVWIFLIESIFKNPDWIDFRKRN